MPHYMVIIFVLYPSMIIAGMHSSQGALFLTWARGWRPHRRGRLIRIAPTVSLPSLSTLSFGVTKAFLFLLCFSRKHAVSGICISLVNSQFPRNLFISWNERKSTQEVSNVLVTESESDLNTASLYHFLPLWAPDSFCFWPSSNNPDQESIRDLFKKKRKKASEHIL